MKNIPEIVLAAARKNGFNSVHFSGEVDGAKAYGVSVVDKDGNPTPMGLPTFLLLKDWKVTMVSGKEGLDLLFKL